MGEEYPPPMKMSIGTPSLRRHSRTMRLRSLRPGRVRSSRPSPSSLKPSTPACRKTRSKPWPESFPKTEPSSPRYSSSPVPLAKATPRSLVFLRKESFPPREGRPSERVPHPRISAVPSPWCRRGRGSDRFTRGSVRARKAQIAKSLKIQYPAPQSRKA